MGDRQEAIGENQYKEVVNLLPIAYRLSPAAKLFLCFVAPYQGLMV
jgi:hypothetical protein